jgi:hypothetical protein
VIGSEQPFVLVRGRGTAIWGMVRGKVVLDPPPGPLTGQETAALAAETADIERFLAGATA